MRLILTSMCLFWVLFVAIASRVSEMELLDQMFNNLQAPEVFLGLMERNPDSECVKAAIKDIANQCTTSGVELVDPALRKKLAVKLSLCELENTYSEIPPACKGVLSDVNVDQCVMAFQEKEQLWTTFSGNYRETFQICYYESLPFTKDQIIGLYQNITRVYHSIYVNLRKAEKVSEATREDMEAKLSQMLENLNEMFERQHEQNEGMKEENQRYKNDVEDILSSALDTVKDNFYYSNDLIGHMVLKVVVLDSQLSRLSDSFEDEEYLKKLEGLKKDTMEGYENINHRSSAVFNLIMERFETTLELTEKNDKKVMELNRKLQDSTTLANGFSESVSDANDVILKQQQLLRDEYRSSIYQVSDVVSEITSALAESIDSDLSSLHYSIHSINVVLNDTLANTKLINSNVYSLTKTLNALKGLGSLFRFPIALIWTIISNRILVIILLLLSIPSTLFLYRSIQHILPFIGIMCKLIISSLLGILLAKMAADRM